MHEISGRYLRLSGLIAAIFCLFIDQATKIYLLQYVMKPPQTIPLLPFLNITYAWNTGVTFGMFHASSFEGRMILVTLALVLSLILLCWLWKSVNRWQAIGLGMAIGGALGNIEDRLLYGAVFDFIDVYIFGYHWYIFNGADIFIDVGMALVMFGYYKIPSESSY